LFPERIFVGKDEKEQGAFLYFIFNFNFDKGTLYV